MPELSVSVDGLDIRQTPLETNTKWRAGVLPLQHWCLGNTPHPQANISQGAEASLAQVPPGLKKKRFVCIHVHVCIRNFFNSCSTLTSVLKITGNS